MENVQRYSFLRQIAQNSANRVFVACMVLLAVVGCIDYATGYELRLYALYFPGVTFVAWTGSRKHSLVYVVLSTVTIVLLKYLGGTPYSSEFYRYVAGLDWLISLCVLAEICLAVRRLYDSAEKANKLLSTTNETLENYASELTTILDAVPAAIYVAHDPECRRITGNLLAHELLGVPMSSNLSRTAPPGEMPTGFSVLVGGVVADPESLPVQVAARGIVQRDCNLDLLFDNGTVKSLLGDAVPLRNGHGEVIGAVGAFVDITERKAMEDALAKNRAILRAALVSMPDTLYITDVDGKILETSDSFAEIYRYPNREAFLTRAEECRCTFDIYTMDGEEVPFEGWPVSAALQGETCPWVEYRVRRRDSGESWLASYSYAPVRDGAGAIIAALVSVRDITEAKRMEEEKHALEKRILNARRLESLGILAGGIAHDFNNLLQVIQGNVEMALGYLNRESPAQLHLIEIQKASTRAARLAHHMLDYSGHGHFVLRHTNLNEVIHEVFTHSATQAPDHIVFRSELSPGLPEVSGSRDQLTEVVTGLIANAVEAIGSAEGEICVSTGMVQCDRATLARAAEHSHLGLLEPLTEGEYVYMDVSDTGPGMDGVTLGKIFDPFFTTKFPGRGLGLSSVLGVMRGHGGTITVESVLGSGTTFRLLFPVNHSSPHVQN